jgi:hypothetical protein
MFWQTFEVLIVDFGLIILGALGRLGCMYFGLNICLKRMVLFMGFRVNSCCVVNPNHLQSKAG